MNLTLSWANSTVCNCFMSSFSRMLFCCIKVQASKQLSSTQCGVWARIICFTQQKWWLSWPYLQLRKDNYKFVALYLSLYWYIQTLHTKHLYCTFNSSYQTLWECHRISFLLYGWERLRVPPNWIGIWWQSPRQLQHKTSITFFLYCTISLR